MMRCTWPFLALSVSCCGVVSAREWDLKRLAPAVATHFKCTHYSSLAILLACLVRFGLTSNIY